MNIDETKYFTTVEKFASIENLVLQLLQKLDEIPDDIVKEEERKIRLKLSIQKRQGLRSFNIQKNLQHQLAQLKRTMQPPQTMTRSNKYNRLRFKKKIEVEIPKPTLTSLQEEYIQAFTNIGSNNTPIQAPDEATLIMIEKMKDSSTPFYVDHLLERLGFSLQKDIITEVEKRDGNEEDFIKYKEMIPDIRTRVNRWMKFKEIEKKNNIENTSYLYE